MTERHLYRNPLWIIREYYHNDRTISDMAKEGKISIGTMSRWVNKLKLNKKRDIDLRYKNYDWMYQKYITEDMSSQEIADELGLYINTVRRWLTYKHKIKKMVYT